MRGVVYEHAAAAQADTARALWPRADDVIAMLEWTLMRDSSAGLPLVEGGSQRLVVFNGAKSGKLPTVECIFECTSQMITICDLEFY